MATNVFGNPVREGTRTERALEALNNPNVDGKRDEALAYVRQLKANWGNGVSTLGIFYNATGETLTFTQEHSSYGQIEGPYPTRVQNGQWGAFFHTKKPVVASGSVAFVVYRVRVDDTIVCNPLIAWSVPWSQVSYNNQAYCDIFEEGKVDTPDAVYRKMESVDSRQEVSIKFGMMVTSQIETGTSPVYEAEFTREDVALIKRKTADQQDVEASVST
ncbi:23 kDa jasmonate-induced protein-like [Helianthus annuus]|uniref:23 kDa jasmonate-induced protein-like n=1 Tax=Helianthus annuus TaxID=4232 RepID=UPI00165313C8|nr:23 kDa jasmonate-induced protein-like [Helianthus annuus]